LSASYPGAEGLVEIHRIKPGTPGAEAGLAPSDPLEIPQVGEHTAAAACHSVILGGFFFHEGWSHQDEDAQCNVLAGKPFGRASKLIQGHLFVTKAG
jgi:hypothetical protein